MISKYNIIVHNGNYHLIFNQLYTSATVLNDETYSRFLNNKLFQHEKDNLIKQGMIVADDFDETKFYLDKRQAFREQDYLNSIIYRLILTTNCNAKCFYCYEKDLPKNNMSQAIVNALLKNIKQEVKNKKVILEWFGGEPLLQYNLINQICKFIQNIKEENNISFTSHLITNGYLLCKKEIRDTIDLWNLKRVQITLDGLKQTYEKIKCYNVPNAFETVLENIKFLIEKKIHVDIRLNYNKENFQEILKLIDYLSLQFKDSKYINVYAHHIFDEKCTANDDSYIEYDKTIFSKLFDCGFIKNVLGGLKIRMGCQANRRNGGTIMPNGDVYRCSMATSNASFQVGTIFKHFETISYWVDDSLTEKCLMCDMLPLCGGGCTYSKIKNEKFCLVSKKDVEQKLNFLLENFIKDKEGGNYNVEY